MDKVKNIYKCLFKYNEHTLVNNNRNKNMSTELNNCLTLKNENFLLKDDYCRFFKNSDQISHVVVNKNKKNAFYYDISCLKNTAVEFNILENIKIKKNKDFDTVESCSKNKKEFISTRKIEISVEENCFEEVFDVFLFSPRSSHSSDKKVFWGSNDERKTIFKNQEDFENQDEFEDFYQEMTELGTPIKKGNIEIIKEDVAIRESMKRTPLQNEVMGISAINEFKQYREQYEDYICDKVLKIFNKTEEARDDLKSQFRPEWLHLISYTLTPINYEPQNNDNLMASLKCKNTEMMVLEKTARFFSDYYDKDVNIILNTNFELLPDSHILEKGYLEVILKGKGKIIKIKKDIVTFKDVNKFPKTSDILQLVLICLGFFNNHTKNYIPVSINDKSVKTSPSLSYIDYDVFTKNNKKRPIEDLNDVKSKSVKRFKNMINNLGKLNK